jgi:LPS-assembly protein
MMGGILARAAVLLLAASMLLPARPALAQVTATLVADSVTLRADRVLVAEGNVEVFHAGTRLSAARITYDGTADILRIDGPIYIVTATGDILSADAATLDPRLQNGILRSARLVLDRQLQLAANRIDRAEGRYTQLTGVAATSCDVCGDGRPPLWEIRARTVTHDAARRQLYFEGATFRIRGVPVAYIPRLRLPDPTLDRATGFLVPSIRRSDILGTGIRLPYFIRIGDSRDLRLTPYLSPLTTTLEARYRQAFLRGDIEIAATLSRDSIRAGEWRGALAAEGAFALDGGWRLSFDLQAVSDAAYARDYGLSESDRLDSRLRLEHVGPRALTVAEAVATQNLVTAAAAGTLPPLLLSFSEERRQPVAGGVLGLNARALGFLRPGDATGASPGDAHDVLRFGLGAGWTGTRVFGPGILAELSAAARADWREAWDEATGSEASFDIAPAAAVTLRWPLLRRRAPAVTDMLEPAVTLGWRGPAAEAPEGAAPPFAEFDDATLLAPGRFPGSDVEGDGAFLAVGLGLTRFGPGGREATLRFGRILRSAPAEGPTATSGLDGDLSDWLVAGRFVLGDRLRLQARTLLDADFAFGKTEARLDWRTDRLDLRAAYLWLPADAGEDRATAVSEWTLATSVAIGDNWTLRLEGRYDTVRDAPVRAGVGLLWRNECVTVDLSLSRRYTSTETVAPATDLDLAVSLDGFSAGRAAGGAGARCRG